jgi:hypothetical protein
MVDSDSPLLGFLTRPAPVISRSVGGEGRLCPGLSGHPIVIENVNAGVNALVNQGLIHRVLAQVEVALSNSLIEAWWRSLKSQWLYSDKLGTVAAVRRLTSFYVSEHNTKMLHAAFHGRTPDEFYFGRGDHVPDQLADARRLARQARQLPGAGTQRW